MSGYATCSDFCRILIADSRSLYLLAFVLTGSHAKAEQCFLKTLDDAANAKSVFVGWERSWINRCLITNAIRLVFSWPVESNWKPDFWSTDSESQGCFVVNTLTSLAPPLQRFVFVMSVLERYSERECAILLGCTPRDVLGARIGAMKQLPSLNHTLTQAVQRNGTYDR